ncbi:MAG TPA: prenyltransferase/squalene oxidase repeat-containing protein [Gemmataceae bacterium]|nr:prenyltransferase/squalene oxidase repeat-containing protein [Gemmataceae bacterium]
MTESHLASLAATRAGGSRFRHDSTHLSSLRAAAARARRCLLDLQRPDGHWVGELQGDTILESEYILLMGFLGRDHDRRVVKAARYIEQQQLPEGGWSNYPGGPVDLSVSVKAYFALKLAGYDAGCPTLRRARERIRELGGAARCNSFSKFYLALLGQFPYDNCPAVPPELCLLPRWAYLNLYAMSSWTRTIVVPLTIFYACKPVRRLPAEKGIAELFLEPPQTPLWPHPPTPRWLTWTNLFLVLDWAFKRIDAFGLGPIREAALQRARDWMFEHFDDSNGVGAIFPPMIYTVISLRALGYGDHTAEMRWAMQQLEDLMIEENDTLRLQPCFSPVWDTALTLIGLADAGLSVLNPAVEKGVRWLLEREVRRRGDWSLLNRNVEPGGWFFEYRNGFYPDVDDTAMVLMALARTAAPSSATNGHHGTHPPGGGPEPVPPVLPPHSPLPTGRAMQRGIRWLLAMQNKDGGWAAFDRGINRDVLTKVPFADHNAMLDPSCPDITARVLEALGHYGYTVAHPRVQKALKFLEKTQDRRGCWIGRWGVNYLYGTWQVLTGLRRVGFDMQQPMVRRAVAWLKGVQQMNGGWGESCRSYDDPKLAGQGPPTASQTAWALLGLLAAGEADSDTVQLGIEYLVATQGPDGNWQEEWFTGTGFPKVFYLKYHMYRLYFPLMALTRYAQAVGPAVVPSSRPSHSTREAEPAAPGTGARSLEAV